MENEKVAKVEYNKRAKGGYYFYSKVEGERTRVGVVESVTTTGKIGSVGYWIASYQGQTSIAETRKGAVAGLKL